MAQHDLRTYRRRGATRESGYHACGETTGGECYVVYAERLTLKNNRFTFYKKELPLVELFERGISIIAFGGYVKPSQKITITYKLSYIYEDNIVELVRDETKVILQDKWTSVGFHYEQPINKEDKIYEIKIEMNISSSDEATVDFISFDFSTISKEEFLDKSCAVSFYQKTSMHIPYLYYLNSTLSIESFLQEKYDFEKGSRVVLKSCNRCGRFLPINIDNELATLSFSLHCKKKSPCAHSTFRAYKIQNISDLQASDLEGLTIEDNSVVSYYGHQLECKACKKFFVNAPLNPQRNSQQFKEDGLRRRAIEVLINELLDTNLIHFEFERRTKKEFSKYIWEKFDRKCFKCDKEIPFEEMALDHTMPLAYLYRLDESATCLCSSHNSQKSDHFPVDYYTEDELVKLSHITGLSLEDLHKKEVNQKVLDLLVENVIWYYDEFLTRPDYQKIRDGIKTSDKINDSLKRIIKGKVDLAEEYKKLKGFYPTSVTILL